MFDRHILVVDDSTVTRQIVRRVLRDIGYMKVLEAKNGQEALDRVTAGQDDIGLVLLDWNMPVLDGMQFLKRVREHPEASRIPVVMVSAASTPSKIMDAFGAGAKNYVIKPFHPNELKVKIEEALHLAEMQEPQEPTTEAATLVGNLSEVGFPALVQLATATGLSGTLTVRSKGTVVAEVGLEDGEVKLCAYASETGEEAFLELATVRDGSFEFVAGKAAGDTNVFKPTMSLLMEAMRRQDEALRAV